MLPRRAARQEFIDQLPSVHDRDNPLIESQTGRQNIRNALPLALCRCFLQCQQSFLSFFMILAIVEQGLEMITITKVSDILT